MDFDSLTRRELQALCKQNKIPANMTNVAMADALKALETVGGLKEFMNQSESYVPQSPATAGIATRISRRNATKEETQSTRSCRVTAKALAGEMDQENLNMNVLQSPPASASRRRAAVSAVEKSEITDKEAENDVRIGADVPKTPATQSTRRRATATASRSKAPETKKDESVQRVYSTRRSVRLLEKSMADLSLKSNRVLREPLKNEEQENETATQEKKPADAEMQEKQDDSLKGPEGTEAIPGRDLSVALEEERETSEKGPEDENKSIHSNGEKVDSEKHGPKDENKSIHPNWKIVDSEKHVNHGDLSVSNAKPELYKEKMNETDMSLAENEAVEKESKVIPVIEQIENGEPLQEKTLSPSKNMIQACKEVLELGSNKKPAEHETSNKKDETSTADDNKTTPAIVKDRTEMCETGLEVDVTLHEVIKDDEDDDPPVSETGNRKESASEEIKIDSDDSETGLDESSDCPEPVTETDKEEDPEQDVSDVDSNQAVSGSDVAISDADFNGVLGSKNLSSENDESLESDQTETDLEEDPEEDIDSKQASLGTDVAVNKSEEETEVQSSAASNKYDNRELKDSESEEDKKSPLAMAPKSPFGTESISGQFPRPTLSTPGKSSSKTQKSAPKLTIVADNNNNNNNDDKDKENSDRKAKQPKLEAAKKNMFDEESLKVVSLRQLTKMVKELNIKKSNRTALQKLPDNNNNNNQTVEQN